MCKRKRDYLEAKSEKFSAKSASGKDAGGVSSAVVGVPPRVTFSAPEVSGKPVLRLHALPKTTKSSKPGQSTSPPKMSGQGIPLTSQSGSSKIHMASGIPTVLSNIGTKSMQHSQSHSKTKTTPPSVMTGARGTMATGKSVDAAKSHSTGKSASKPSKTKASPPASRNKPTSGGKLHKKPQATHKEDVRVGGVKRDKASLSRFGGDLSSDYLSRAAPEGYDPQLLEYMEGLERYRTRLSKTKP